MVTVPPPIGGLIARLQRCRLSDIALCGVFLVIYALTLRPVVDNDVFWHLATGRFIWKTGIIPHTDPFSWSSYGRPWIAHEWLTETLLYPLFSWGSYRALMLVFGAIIVAAFAVAYKCGRLFGGSRTVTASVIFLAAVASLHTWGIRPQMISLLLLSLLVLVLGRAHLEQRPRLLLVTLPLMFLWVNLHGGFIFGLATLGLAAVGTLLEALWNRVRRGDAATRRRSFLDAGRLLLVTGACTIVCLINPNGLRGLVYPFSYLGNNASMRYVSEWVPPNFHQFQYDFFGALLLLLLVGLVGTRRRPTWTEVLSALVYAVLGLRSVRNINLFCIVVAPLIAVLLTSLLSRLKVHASTVEGPRERNASPRLPTPGRGLLNAGLILVIALGILFSLSSELTVEANTRAQAKIFPAGAVSYISRHRPPRRLFNSYDWGGYLIWHLSPLGIPDYVDGRPDMYGDHFIDSFIRVWRAEPGWQRALQRQKIGAVLVERSSGLGRALRTAAGWRLVYHDHLTVLYERTQ